MSWHGTLTCSYCYEKGHTRRKCPQMKKRHDEYQRHIDNGTQDDAEWYLRSAHREWKEQQKSLDEKGKVCAFCGEHGHRVGTCPQRMKVVDKLKKLDRWFIPIVQSVLTEMGMGVGTMIKGSGYVGSEYRNDIPYMITKSSQARHKQRGGLSIVNLWVGDWIRPEVTEMIMMRKSNIRLPEDFKWHLVQKLFHILELPEGYDWNERGYRQREYLNQNPLLTAIGHIPFPPTRTFSEQVVSTMSEPFPNDEDFGWDFDKKREVNRLFRDSKNSLVSEDISAKVERLYDLLSERGVL